MVGGDCREVGPQALRQLARFHQGALGLVRLAIGRQRAGLAEQEGHQQLAVGTRAGRRLDQRLLHANGMGVTLEGLGPSPAVHQDLAEVAEDRHELLVDARVGGARRRIGQAELAAADEEMFGLIPAPGVATQDAEVVQADGHSPAVLAGTGHLHDDQAAHLHGQAVGRLGIADPSQRGQRQAHRIQDRGALATVAQLAR